jgi:choice-of-anchor B domain-containing protein
MIKYILSILLLAVVSQLPAQQNIELVSNLPYQNGLSDIWGYEDTSGVEYALVAVKGAPGGNGGLSVVSLEDPSNPEEIFFAPGTSSTWRDIKTYNGYAYVTTEAADGLMILNLNGLPDTNSISVHSYLDVLWITAHNLYIDENGHMYVFGAGNDSLGVDGVLIYDLNGDPLSPEFIGEYNVAYVHDGMAKGDTLYTANVYQGTFSIVDVSDPENPVYLGGATTPDSFTHNIWVSDDGDHVYTTDEVSGAFIASYDISDLDDIEEKDRVQIFPGSQTIVHNVHYMNDYLITSYYKAGVTIHDVSDPENMILTGHYDTSPMAGSGFNGAWGVSPFLPSGLIIASDISEGLFVLQPNYTRASRLEGQITDSETSNPIFNAEIEILESEYEAKDESDVQGNYKTGLAEAGLFDVLVSKFGYIDVLVEDVELVNGEVTILNVSLEADLTISVDEREWEDVRIYPNPISDRFTIEIPNSLNTDRIVLELSDLSGRKIYSEQLNSGSNSIYLDQKCENGVYLIALYSSERAVYKTKVVISNR